MNIHPVIGEKNDQMRLLKCRTQFMQRQCVKVDNCFKSIVRFVDRKDCKKLTRIQNVFSRRVDQILNNHLYTQFRPEKVVSHIIRVVSELLTPKQVLRKMECSTD